MAEAKGRRTAAADFVSKIVKDPKQPPNTLLLKGYLGDSSEEGYTRLYLDPQLSDYVEIPADAILHTQDVADDPLGGSYIWIQRDAEVIHGRLGGDRPKAKFLEGRIYQQYMKGAQFGGARAIPPDTLFCEPTQHPGCPQTVQCEQTKPPLCPPSVFDGPCPTDFHICEPQSYWWGCPPSVFPQQCPPIPSAYCPSHYQPLCPPTVPPQCLPPTKVLPQCQPSVFFPQCQPPTLSPQCQVMSAFSPQCQPATLRGCPSAVDACPSAWGCGNPRGFPGGWVR